MTMNPLLSKELIENELEADPAAARAEWLSIFRDDVSSFLGIDLLRSAIVEGRPGRHSSPEGRRGRGIHRSDRGAARFTISAAVASIDAAGRVTINAIREAKPPFSPEQVTTEFAQFFKTYGINEVVSDRWGGAWVEEMWGKTEHRDQARRADRE